MVRFLHSVLIKAVSIIARSPLPETGFSLKGATRISGFLVCPSRSGYFLVSFLVSEGEGSREEREERGEAGGRGVSPQRGARKAEHTVESLEKGEE